MESVDAKIRRAHHHLNDLTRGLADLAKAHRPKLFLKHNAHAVWLTVYFEEPYAPFSHSAVFGDFLYNLRSSLDALIYGLVRANGGNGTRRTCFPIFDAPASYEAYSKLGTKADVLAGVSDEARALVKQFQPFMRGGTTATLDPLYLLNLMCNRDKHSAAHLMLGYAKDVEFHVHFGSGRVARCAPDGPLIGHGPWQVAVPMPVSHVESDHRVEVVGRSDFLIGADAPWQGRSVLELSHVLLRHVEGNVIQQFKALVVHAG
jgi:hypothetical protein